MEGASLEDLNAALRSEAAEADEERKKYLTFRTDKQLYAVPISNVEQITGMQDITSVPDYPEYVKGIINMRGTIIPVLDFRLRMGKKETTCNDRTCIVVVNCSQKDGCQGYIVDGVEEVMDVSEEQFSPPVKVDGNAEHRFVTGIIRQPWGNGEEERLILCVDPVKVMSVKENDKLKRSGI